MLSFLVFNLLIGVVLTLMKESRAVESGQARDRRRLERLRRPAST
ncbi:hypothetical protein [Mycobacterium pinniadriaticum]|uniref:Uncharacterized protein n=2 Tax=Mycobacterium pinniadriaticum TaxID=2994102 RepID=A0ABT3SLY2_9MYCO|nr:hypothetical protein [Mycobacterium pinniadriaticum]MCX2940532.1 hypothetical protein [Mycobacterium pinniadriaticum]